MRILNSAICESLELRRLVAADLTASIVTTLPTAIPLAGNVITVNVTNAGDSAAIGTVETGLVFRNVATPLEFTTLTPAHIARRINLAPGASVPIVLKFNVPTTLVAGTYTLTAKADIGEVLVEVDETNNESAAATIEIRAPFVDLSGTVGNLAIKPVKLGKRGGMTVVPLNLLNSGNVPLKGNSTLNFFVSTDSIIGNGDDIAAGANLPLRGLNIGANKTKILKRPAKLPATLASGNYFVIAVLDPANLLIESDDTNNSAISATQITVTNPFAPTGTAKLTLDGIEITDGQVAPVDFGSALQNLAGPTKTFTVTNVGQGTLTLGTISLPPSYFLDEGLVAALAAGESDTFTLSLQTDAIGTQAGGVSIATTDPKRNPFNLNVTGSVAAPASPTLNSQLEIDAAALLVGEPDQIQYTAAVGGSNSSVALEVVETDSAGVVLHKVVDLFDDGSGLHGDSVAGDGIFNNATAISFDTAGDRFFLARFTNNSQQTQLAKLSGVNAPSAPQVQAIIDNNAVQRDLVVVDIFAGKSDAQIINALRDRLLALPDLVVPESISINGSSIAWDTPQGLRSIISVPPIREELAANSTLSVVTLDSAAPASGRTTITSDCGCGDPVAPAAASSVVLADDVPMQQCKQATVLSPFAWRKASEDGAKRWVTDLVAKDWNVVARQNFNAGAQDVTVDDFARLAESKVIVISTDVVLDGKLAWLSTGQRISILGVDIPYLVDWMSGRLTDFNGIYAISRRFISHYGGKMKDAVVYVEASNSAIDDRLATPFIARGAAAYLGFTGETRPGVVGFQGQLASKTLVTEGKAISEIPRLNDELESPSKPSRFVCIGNEDAKLKDTCNKLVNMEVVIQYSWDQSKDDLDTGTTFLNGVVGFGAGVDAGNIWLNWTSGDNTSNGGTETVKVAIGQAFAGGHWGGTTTINCAAGWFADAGGSGPAVLTVILRDTVTGEEIDAKTKQINPGQQDSLATTPVGVVTITTSGVSSTTTATISLS